MGSAARFTVCPPACLSYIESLVSFEHRMKEYELQTYVGQKIRYDIPPHFGWKKQAEGIGTLDYYKEQGWWQIRMPDGMDFLLHDEMFEQIEFDRHEKILSFVYIP